MIEHSMHAERVPARRHGFKGLYSTIGPEKHTTLNGLVAGEAQISRSYLALIARTDFNVQAKWFHSRTKSFYEVRFRLAPISKENQSTDVDIDTAQECCDIDGLAIDGAEEDCQLTTFENVACCTSIVRGAHPAKNPLHVPDVEAVTDIVQYLSRPYVLTSGTLNNTAAGFPWAATMNVASYYSTNPNWGKTANAYGIRSTACFKLQVLATPQHSGIYRLAFQPMTSERFSASSSLQISYLPHAQLNLNNGTEVTLKVPFIHPFNYMVRNDTTFSLGRIVLWALTPTGVAAGELPPTYRIWSWLEDVELIGAASTNAQAFSSQSGKKTIKVSSISTTKKAQAPVTSGDKKSAPAKELKAANLSSILAAGGQAASFVGKMIPAISGFAGTTQWALDYAANLAFSFGWSKPRDSTPVHKVFQSMNTGQQNVDGASNAHNLSLLSENALAVAPLAGTDVDEMALAYVLTRPAITTKFTYSNQVSNTDLYTFTVRPDSIVGLESGNHTSALPVTGSFFVPMLTYYANEFYYWRGTIRVRLTAASTKFHAGRLLVGFTPSNTSLLAPSSSDALNYKSVVWDIRDSTTLEFDIPFIFPKAYALTSRATGIFFVRVLDPLTYPANVSPSVPFLVEHSAGPDFECARPAVATLIPNNALPSFFSQSSSKVFNMDERSPADLCIGEGVKSVKQLISRATFIGSLTVNTYTSLENMNTSPSVNGSIVAKWKACYTFWRGSYDYHFLPNNTNCTVTASVCTTTDSWASPFSDIVVSEQKGLHVSVPYYKDTPMVSYTTCNITPTSKVRVFVSSNTAEATDRVGMFSNYGDDTQFFYFIGPPGVTAKPTNVAPYNDLFFGWACKNLPSPALALRDYPLDIAEPPPDFSLEGDSAPSKIKPALNYRPYDEDDGETAQF